MPKLSNHALFLSANPVFAGLAPVVFSVFFGFLAVSVPLGALTLELGGRLGFGPFIVGLVIGAQSVATLLTRHQAGSLCDQKGPRKAILIGLPLAAASGGLYLLACLPQLMPVSALTVLVLGRVVMGVGESLFLTGLMSLGISRLGPERTGRVMSWTGIALYAALGLGAPLGLAVQSRLGFAGVALITALAPLIALAMVSRLPAPAPAASGGGRVPFHRVLGLIWRPGLVLTLSIAPYAVIATFLPLHYAAQGWPHAGLALFGFASAYVCVRLFGSGLPDQYGAVPVAIGSLVLELLGQGLLWLAPSEPLALLGAVLTGLGFSLVFPAMGVLATRSVPPEQRGRAVGNFMAFADIALGLTGPLAGLVTQWAGLSSAFILAAIASAAALLLLPSIRTDAGR